MNKPQLITSLKNQGFLTKITNAFKKIKRENFIPQEYKKYAYEDSPIPIGHNQTISQPYTIAFMLNLLNLKPNLKILEVGSGSGYVLALINQISPNSQIYGIERIKELATNSKKVLNKNKNIHIISADGTKGLKLKAPFDRILVSASSNQIPKTLLQQLSPDGTMVCVVNYSIIVIKKRPKGNKITEHLGFSFVPLINE